MPSTTLLEIPLEEQVQMRAILRRARYGSLLAFHILLLCAAGRNPTEIAAFLFCSRSSVYRIVRAYRTGSLGISVDQEGRLAIAVQTTVLMPWLQVALHVQEVRSPDALEAAFAAMTHAGVEGFVVLPDPLLPEQHISAVTALALRYRLPAMYPWKHYADAGGLMAYGLSLPDFCRRGAAYV